MKPFLVLVAALVALALGAFALLRVIQRPAPDVGVTVARRELLYEVGPGARVGFALPAERSDLRISSHLVLDARAGYDPARQYLYGLRVRVESPEGKELFRRELFFRARQSKAQRVGDRWRYENAFVPGGDVQLADRESMELWLPSEPPPPRSVLWIEALGQERRVWLNVYRREPEARGRSPRELALAAGEARANRVTYTPWGELMAEGLAARWPAWEKLAPEGESGRDYEPRAMYFSGFVLRARQEAPIHLEPGRRATLTVGGPVALAVRLSRMGGAAGSRRLRVEGLAVDGRRHEWMLALEAGQDEGMSDLPVPEGQHSLRLSTDEGPLSVEVFHLAREPEGSPGARTWPVPADEVRFDTYVASADCPPVEYDLGEPLEGEAALLRVDARTVGRVPEGGTRVELRWVDPEGREVPGGTVAVAPVPSPFERAHFPPGSPLLLGADGGVTDPAEAALAVSEPQSVHAVLPPRTRRVRLSASSPVLLSVFSLWAAPGPSTMVPPYESPDGGTLAWRYAPRERQLWYPLRAERHEEQEASGCVADVVAQVRLEAREDPDAGVSTGLEPLGGVAAQDVLERVDPVDRAEVVARWDGLSFTRLRPDEPVRLMFSRALAARPQLAYVLPAGDARQLGETVEVRVDGKPLHSFVLRTTRGRELLPPVPPGVHTVRISSGARRLGLLLNRPPAGDAAAELVRVRTAYRLGQAPLTFGVRTLGVEPVTVTLALYSSDPRASEGTPLRVQVDSGAPARRVGLTPGPITVGERRYALPAARPGREVGFLEAAGGPLHVRFLSVTLGTDLPPGFHTVSLRSESGIPVWAHLSAVGAPVRTRQEVRGREGWTPVGTQRGRP